MTKMVCTLGPASCEPEKVQALVDIGMRIGRINMSHVPRGDYSFPLDILKRLRASVGVHSALAEEKSGAKHENVRAALLDTKGPEVRTGFVAGGGAYLTLEDAAEIELSADPAHRDACTPEVLYCDYAQLATTVAPGSTILLDDGLIALEVLACTPAAAAPAAGGDDDAPAAPAAAAGGGGAGPAHGSVRCRVRNGGQLGSTKGVNLPGAVLELPPMTVKDKEDLHWAVEQDFDYVAASFVRKASDVRSVVAYLERCCDIVRKERAASGAPAPDIVRPQVISKIESQEGVINFDEILEASDGIMVARGDLGVEIPFAELLIIQKRMVRKCNEAGKPVIVATQMLESMRSNPRPTRAEVTDVGNAVLDGTDAVMLSGETANGKYPELSAETMQEIVTKADHELDGRTGYSLLPAHRKRMYAKVAQGTSELEACAAGAVQTATAVKANLIIVISRAGGAARLVAKYRPNVPVMAFTSSPKIARQLMLHRGIFPVALEISASYEEQERVVEAIRTAKEIGWLKDGHRVVLVDAEVWRQNSNTLTKASTVKVFTV